MAVAALFVLNSMILARSLLHVPHSVDLHTWHLSCLDWYSVSIILEHCKQTRVASSLISKAMASTNTGLVIWPSFLASTSTPVRNVYISTRASFFASFILAKFVVTSSMLLGVLSRRVRRPSFQNWTLFSASSGPSFWETISFLPGM